jgi:hypothetical protein
MTRIFLKKRLPAFGLSYAFFGSVETGMKESSHPKNENCPKCLRKFRLWVSTGSSNYCLNLRRLLSGIVIRKFSGQGLVIELHLTSFHGKSSTGNKQSLPGALCTSDFLPPPLRAFPTITIASDEKNPEKGGPSPGTSKEIRKQQKKGISTEPFLSCHGSHGRLPGAPA